MLTNVGVRLIGASLLWAVAAGEVFVSAQSGSRPFHSGGIINRGRAQSPEPRAQSPASRA